MPSIALRQVSPLRKLLVCMQTLLRVGHDVKFRGSYAPCRSAESRIFSRLPSPAIAVSTTFEVWHVWRTRERRAGWGSMSSPLGVPFAVDGSQNKTRTGMEGPRCTGRRSTAIAESSESSSAPTPTSTPRTTAGEPLYKPFRLASAGVRPPAHPDANRWTPLHYTADNGDADTIEELLLSGAVALQNCVG